jgi:5-methylcytosine-specific restriction endonuclease McrBC GTP-binding regulatory subunit McrB
MSKYYLLFLPPDTVKHYISFDQTRINIHQATTELQIDDKIVPVRTSAESVILPFLYTIAHINRSAGTITLVLEEIYTKAMPFSKFAQRKIATLTSLNETYSMSQADFLYLVEMMGGKRMEELKLLEFIQSYIKARGYYFEDETLFNYHICLKTRPFVILAGLSGTGKSKLSQLYAEAIGPREHHLRLAVRPNWNDDHYLLGHLNIITGEYVVEEGLEFLMEANADQDTLYFFCLDEMNLAHVEYYFSQFLSAMEEDEADRRTIHLLSKQAQKQYADTIPSKILLPSNLFFTGTINVDETTQPISDKVIDRANTLEFFTVDLDKIPVPTTPPDPIGLSAFTWESYRAKTPDTTFRAQIIEISKILNQEDLGLGYRVLHDIELYLANSKNLLEPLVAFDLQVKQRILPRVRGSAVISNMMKELLAFMERNKLTRSKQRLQEMNKRLERDGYTSFWR